MNYSEVLARNKAWLLTLNVGDSVAYESTYRGYAVTTIVKITPKRQITTADNVIFKEGIHRAGFGNTYQLEPVTDKILNLMSLKSNLLKIKGFKFESLRDSQLKRIIEIMDEKVE